MPKKSSKKQTRNTERLSLPDGCSCTQLYISPLNWEGMNGSEHTTWGIRRAAARQLLSDTLEVLTTAPYLGYLALIYGISLKKINRFFFIDTPCLYHCSCIVFNSDFVPSKRKICRYFLIMANKVYSILD